MASTSYTLYVKATVLLVVYHAHLSSSSVTRDELPYELQDCYNSYSGVSLDHVVGQSLCWSCEAPDIRRLRTSKQPSSMTSSGLRYVNDLVYIAESRYRRRGKRQAGGRCVRKEYRAMTDRERENFHRAINALKNNNNRYDILAGLHTGDAIRPAHRGPNFLGWHRVYLLLLEIALQEVDPSVCLPYWDSSLDNDLEVPSSSYVFSADFMGGGRGNGQVRDGPFANWRTPNDGPLIRNIGVSGQLYSATAIRNILSQRRHSEITPPSGDPQNGLEFHHNGVHAFIGGQMNNLNAAAYDPAFFLHHCFVDYLWEVFRTNQRRRGEFNPENDYPANFGDEFHAPDRIMGFGLNITARQGYSDDLTDTYVYEPSPSCPDCAGSRYLQCIRGRCLPVVPPPTTTPTPSTTTTSASTTMSTTPGTPSTTTPNPGCPTTTPKPCKKYPYGNQNTFCCDGVCDTRGWVYVPVEVISKRSPYLSSYDSYPVYNGSISQTQDIYMPTEFEAMSNFMPKGKPKGYEKCNGGEGVGQIFVQSSGLSYNGFYKESAIIDQRLQTSIAIAYVAVKDPKNGPVKALFRAFDSCGRICHTSCKNPRTQEYEACSGVLNIKDTPGRPQQYSHSYGQATLNTWSYRDNRDCPRFREDDIVLSFYCDYGDRLPWVDPTYKPTTTTTPKPTTTPEQNKCRVDSDCTIDVPCTVNSEWQCRARRQKCIGTCNMYAVCFYGTYIKQKCPRNLSFDSRRGTCTSRRVCYGKGRKPTRGNRKPPTTGPYRPTPRY